jgi:hypothetical protein
MGPEAAEAAWTLRVWDGRDLVFSSGGHWLHPLFDLEARIADLGDPARLRLEDRVTGRAAAFLVVRLGFRELHSHCLSDRAVPVLERAGVRTTCEARVPRIGCATEDLLAGVEDPEAAWALLAARRGR